MSTVSIEATKGFYEHPAAYVGYDTLLCALSGGLFVCHRAWEKLIPQADAGMKATRLSSFLTYTWGTLAKVDPSSNNHIHVTNCPYCAVFLLSTFV